jgi:hypothetical protein
MKREIEDINESEQWKLDDEEEEEENSTEGPSIE